MQMLHYPYTFPSGSPLHWAVEFSCVEAVRALLRYGVDPWLPSSTSQFIFAAIAPDSKPQSPHDIHDEWILDPSKGPTAVEVAIQNWDYTILDLLLEEAPKGPETRTDDEIGLFQHLIAAEFRWIGDFAEALVDAGADVNVAGNDGRTAIMHLGAKYAPLLLGHYGLHKDLQTRVVRFLLEKGARVDISDNAGQPPALVLARDGLVGAIEVLLQHGAVADDCASPGSSIWTDEEFPIFTALSRYGGNDEEFTENRDQEIAALLGEYVVPLLGPVTGNASAAHETLLRNLAWNGLYESAAVLLKEGVNANPLSAANFIPGVEASERGMTPLDEVVSRCATAEISQGRLSKSEVAELKARYRRMEELLRSYGGRLAEELEVGADD
ncbi:hypothetical protein ACJZ2D_015182 [Fusarium nematophilum]